MTLYNRLKHDNHQPNPVGPCLPGIPGGPLKSVAGLLGQDAEIDFSPALQQKLLRIFNHNTMRINHKFIAI